MPQITSRSLATHYTRRARERIEPQNSPDGLIFRMREKPVAPVNAAPGD
jgi:hypothetical protein